MTRVAPAASTEATRPVEEQILKTRGEITLLYQILLNSPAVCEGWEALLTVIRQKTGLPPRLRELIILRIAVLNDAPYEYNVHVPFGRKAGLRDDEMEAVRGTDLSAFDERDRLALEYTDSMTRAIHVPDDLFARVQAAHNPKMIVELTATIAAYNMVSRFLEALRVH